ncbi:MAG: hypothetical protein B0D96_02690 [Candidatus Sedimenticola endophacoides]|uniref:DUF302 domain-containing protein n=1 Tax=Candidatus Sedimenticola endophacoides TaxID=2548426 RepID=A0A657Q0G8_9GAMM|nr:MAG: hypothetical protein B0D94_05650 [Candidatus Sedimenticola endophacoides]OQX33824.1 MAG: hypothetical protein B0D84_04135 [Candidatus Sedimenticola endophacoides]OQX37163.1 MAG: hypothetical protein B0D96_02690 [Candidatus Sedimenticola endophacoides]OQX39325.1 MAG: hypothetical protein B0D88_09510 [Candidatus Sedimenticola endophacoides]OQX39336.1 MAG: hypothetical protein B0D89_10975 [Candidatus Sedimenticola endophacoides]
MYEFNLTLERPFESALQRVRECLMEEQLGIVSEVDVQAVFRAKLEKTIPPYRILGACNPLLAERVIEEEPNAGALLPCNLVVRALDAERTQVSFMDPESVLSLSPSAPVRQVGREAKEKLLRVAERLGQ